MNSSVMPGAAYACMFTFASTYRAMSFACIHACTCQHVLGLHIHTHTHTRAHTHTQTYIQKACASYGECSGSCKGCAATLDSEFSFLCVANAGNAGNCTALGGVWHAAEGVCRHPSTTKWDDVSAGCPPGFNVRTCADLNKQQCTAKNALYNGTAGLLTCGWQHVECTTKEQCEAGGICDQSAWSVSWMVDENTCKVPWTAPVMANAATVEDKYRLCDEMNYMDMDFSWSGACLFHVFAFA
jgi:hypothetical protein